LRQEKATLEGMVESHDELIMEIAREILLYRMGEKKRMKRKKRMLMTEEMPLHPLFLRPLLPHMWRLSRRKNQ
jgi:hypothetical protein